MQQNSQPIPSAAPRTPLSVTIACLGDTQVGKTCLVARLSVSMNPNFRIPSWYRTMGITELESYRWSVDRVRLERETRCTIRGNIISLSFPKLIMNWLDPPGKKQLRDKMIRMLNQADGVVMCINEATQEALDQNLSREGRFTYFAAAAYMFGIRQVVVCVTKFQDENSTLDNEDQASLFDTISSKIMACLKRCGFKETHVLGIIPVSSLKNWNIMKAREYPWFAGKCLNDLLQQFVPTKKTNEGSSLLQITRVYRIGGVGTVICGGIVRGVLSVGDTVIIAPGMIVTQVQSIEIWHNSVKSACPGDQVGVNVKNVSVHEFSAGFRGFLVGERNIKNKTPLDLKPRQTPAFYTLSCVSWVPSEAQLVDRFDIPAVCFSFIADIVLVRTHTSKRANPFGSGTALNLEYRLMTQSCRVVRIIAKLYKSTFTVHTTLVSELNQGDLLRVEFSTPEPCCVQEFDVIPQFSRIVLSDNLGIVAAGLVRRKLESYSKLVVVNISDWRIPNSIYRRFPLMQVETKLTSLQGVNLLIVSQLPKQQKQVIDFVNGGGTLVCFKVSSPFLPLLETFGITLATESTKTPFQFTGAITCQRDKQLKFHKRKARFIPAPEIKSIPKSHSSAVWMPQDVLRLIFSFLDDELDLLSCSQVCRDWRNAANSEILWQNLCLKRKIHTCYSYDQQVTSWKTLFQNYHKACKIGNNFVSGPCGNVGSIVVQYNETTLGLRSTTNNNRDIVPLAHKLVNHGGECIVALVPRFGKKRKGQALFLSGYIVEYGAFSGKKSSSYEKFWLNVFTDAQSRKYFNQ